MEEDSEDSSSELPSNNITKSISAGFSLLASDSAHVESEDEEEEAKATKKKNKKKKKKGGAAIAPQPPKPATKSEKSSAKKGKGKANQEDDLDRALAELSLKYSDITIPDTSSILASAPSIVSALHTLRSLLSIQPKYLDADAEMRRFFGSGVIRSADASSSSTPTQRMPVARSTLCKPQNTWPPGATRDGLTMRLLTDDERKHIPPEDNWMSMPGEKWYTVEHSPSYRWDQRQFIQIVGMLDPNHLFALMRESYWHVDTLLQISEVYRAQDDHSVSSDFISRAIFSYERSFSGSFSLTGGASRLDFRRIENRSLFLALHRTILSLERRGTMRTAFEFARLLWALDPWTDPHLALAHLDFLSVKTEQYEWFLETESSWEEATSSKSFAKSLKSLPGWVWSKSLVLRGLGTKKGGGEAKATEALRQAILDFPEVLLTLSSLVGVDIPASSRLPTSISRWNASDTLPSAISLLCKIYAHRSVSLWKIPENLSWLNSTLKSVSAEIKSNNGYSKYSLGDTTSSIDAIVRHAIVSDLKPLAPFVGSILATIGPQEVYDIVTPKAPGTTVYDEQYFSLANAESAKKRREAQNPNQRRGRTARNDGIQVDPVEFLQMLEEIFVLDPDDQRRQQILRALGDPPGSEVVRQLERWVRSHPDFAQQFPNARAYLLLPPTERPRPPPENINPQIAPDIPAVAPQIAPMPGAFTGDAIEEQMRGEGSEHDSSDEGNDSEDENGAPLLPVRIARGIMNLFTWGDRRAEADESDTEEEEEG
ncbi:hypothetical protein FRC20_008568 [Serendipita sp. 405]|nr:hypothetical protein FRC15_012101 [Serendipita sp. 397]KAG8873169.1 hypothetical protein FRC20_008568 [Serendipita sp. 405]